MENDLLSILENFSGTRILVVGEAILDSSLHGNANRLSLEGPVPVVDVHTGYHRPGGAANVAVNARRLGAQVDFLSVVGQDAEGDMLVDLLEAEGIQTGGILRHSQRTTLLKRRIYVESQLVVRYDQGDGTPVDKHMERNLLRMITEHCPSVDILILSDYGQGVITDGLIEGLARLQEKMACPMIVDTKRLNAFRKLQLAAVRPSFTNVQDILNGEANSNGSATLEKLSEAGEKILNSLQTQMVTITLDDNGALVLDRDIPVYRTYAPRMPFNRVSGAGDAFISGLALSLASDAQGAAAGEIASAVASIVVEKEGLAACCIEELKYYLGGDQKLVDDWKSLEERLSVLRSQGKRIVFTNGVFDILHSAHVAYLNQAKGFGDILVLGVNTDESVRRLKGPERPINGQIERSRVLAGLSCVDFVVPFGESNPINLIHHVRPDIYVKGGDYTRETLPEAEVVEGYGGTLQLVPYIANHSTTGVIERIRKIDGKK